MHAWMDGWMDGWVGGWMDGWVRGWMDERMGSVTQDTGSVWGCKLDRVEVNVIHIHSKKMHLDFAGVRHSRHRLRTAVHRRRPETLQGTTRCQEEEKTSPNCM